VNVRGPIPILFLCALFFAPCAETILKAQTPVPAAAPAAVDATKDSSNDLSVIVGKSALVDFTKPVIRVAVGLGDIAEATVVSPTEVMVNGRGPGSG
jgi:Flp pilus assembly secretin CpaC